MTTNSSIRPVVVHFAKTAPPPPTSSTCHFFNLLHKFPQWCFIINGLIFRISRSTTSTGVNRPGTRTNRRCSFGAHGS
ncbi:hypothetical protein RchiOBHm_Chr2g0103651 [Rosa chinensis]|uniref:Uncharacterized protein n=1 Tax=Rosa chinensis TaxID=74649 RepID=A0A2P6RN02_ROSCH|nr:hypothetical protein RchiOBHm_Chr2g0103651 [Rosa chinensis]